LILFLTAPENVNIPSGTIPVAEIDAHCRAYEEKINRLGIDIMLLGVSSDGSIGTFIIVFAFSVLLQPHFFSLFL